LQIGDTADCKSALRRRKLSCAPSLPTIKIEIAKRLKKGTIQRPIGPVATSNKLQLAFRDFPGFFTHNTTRYAHRD
jgi:hypothetical protein